LAVKAARADALRRLTERVKGVYVTPRITVADMVADSDQPDVNMLTFVVPRETAVRYHDDDLIVELEMSVKLRTLYGGLRNWAEGHYMGTKVKIADFEELILKSQDMTIKAPGIGVPPEECLLANAPAEVAPLVRMVGGRPPEWLSMRLEAAGTAAVDAANPDRSQAELLAYRAAEVDARRKLAERINGLMVTSSLSVRDLAARNDQIARAMLTFQQTPQEVADARKPMPDGKVETRMAVELRPLWDMIVHYQKKR
jgi:hypothetical protein